MFDHIHTVDLERAAVPPRAATPANYTCDALIIATGASAKYLGLPSEQKFMGTRRVGLRHLRRLLLQGPGRVVVGGGNTAVEEALYLVEHRQQRARWSTGATSSAPRRSCSRQADAKRVADGKIGCVLDADARRGARRRQRRHRRARRKHRRTARRADLARQGLLHRHRPHAEHRASSPASSR